MIVVLCAINVVGVKEAAGLNVVLAFTDFSTQLMLVILGCVLVLSPHTLIHNVHLGVVPPWKNFIIAIPVAMIAYTGIETISNMAEEAKDEAHTIPAAIKGVVLAVFAIYARCPRSRCRRCRCTCNAAGNCQTLLGLSEDKGGFAGDPVLGIVKHLNLGPLQHAGEIYVGLLAATILFIATNAGIIGVSRLVYSMGLHRQVPDQLRQLHPHFRTPWIGIIVFGGIACLTLIPGQADVPGQHVRVRRDAVVHDRAPRGDPLAADAARPRAALPRARHAASRRPQAAAVRGRWAGSGTVLRVRHRDRPARGRRRPPASAGWRAGVLVYIVYRRRQGLDLTTTTKVAIPRPATETEAEYESVLVAFDEHGGYEPEVMATAARLAARRRRGIHVLVTISVPPTSPIDARAARAGGDRPVDHRGGQGPGRPARVAATGRRCAPGRPGAGSSTRPGRCTPRRS